MKKTRIVIISAAVVLLAAALTIIGRQRAAEKPPAPSESVEQENARMPGFVYYDGTNATEDPHLTKGQFVERYLDLSMKDFKKQAGGEEMPEDGIEYLQNWAAEAYRAVVEKEGGPPRLSIFEGFNLKVEQVTEASTTPVVDRYDGPQTVESLVERYDDSYSSVFGSERELDKLFPREEWIQRALDLGVVFHDFRDYSGLMSTRSYVANVLNDPDHYDHQHKLYGLDDRSNYDAFFDREILLKIWRNEQRREAEIKHPESDGGFFYGGRYIPTRDNQVHVKITPGDPSHSIIMFGPRARKLTREERHLLKYHGIAPEGIEAVYLDENNQPMPPGSEPIRADWKDRVAVMSEYERQEALQETVELLNSDRMEVMTIVDWMTLADFTGALLDYTEGGRAGVPDAPPVPPAPSGFAASSEGQAPPPSEQELPRLLPSGVELPKSPGKSREDVDAFFDFLDLHLIENADVPENVRRGLKQRYEAYQMWKDQDRLRRQEPAPPSPPSNEDGETSDEEDDE